MKNKNENGTYLKPDQISPKIQEKNLRRIGRKPKEVNEGGVRKQKEK